MSAPSGSFASALGELRRRLGFRARRAELDDELDEEMRFHLEMLERDAASRGLDPAQARRAAERQFGSAARIKEASRDYWSLGALDAFGRDLRVAARVIRRAPGYAIAVVLAFALGIGAATAAFAVIDAVLLRPLPYADAGRLVTATASIRGATPGAAMSWPDVRDLRAGNTGLERMAFVRGTALPFRGTEGAVAATAALVTEDFFPVLGVRPAAGRFFLPDEMRPGAPRAVVLGHALWQRQFGADPAVVGRTLDFADGAATIVGVMPRGSTWPGWADLYVPLASVPREMAIAERRDLRIDNRVIARLAPGVAIAAADARLDAIAARLEREYPAENAGIGVHLRPLHEEEVGDVGRTLGLLAGAVALVLLITCANVANLSVARALARARELAVRAALGASRWRVLSPIAAETTMLSLAGGALGLALAAAAVKVLVALAPPLPRATEIALDPRAALVAAAIALGCGLLCGLAPALAVSGRGPASALGGGRGAAGHSPGRARARSALVAAQCALALILLVGAGLLLESFGRLRAVDPGFDPRGLVAVRLNPPEGAYADPARRLALFAALEQAARATPGVAAAALVNHLPMTGAYVPSPIRLPGAAQPADTSDAVAYRTVSGGYFETMRIAVVRGRGITDADLTAPAPVAVISEGVARRYWPNADPLGRRVTVFRQAQGDPDFNQPITAEIVGVAREVRHFTLADTADRAVYLPVAHTVWPNTYLVARARCASGTASGGAPCDASAIVAPLRRALAKIDPDIPVSDLRPVSVILERTVARERFTTTLLGAFAAAALLLAAVGVYGVIAYAVAARERELGVRMALGARPADVVGLVVRQGARLVAAGLALGVAGALYLARGLESLLFGVRPWDTTVFVAAVLAIGGAGVLACLVPALRASRVDPLVAIRAD